MDVTESKIQKRPSCGKGESQTRERGLQPVVAYRVWLRFRGHFARPSVARALRVEREMIVGSVETCPASNGRHRAALSFRDGVVDFVRREVRFADGKRNELSELEASLLHHLAANA